MISSKLNQYVEDYDELLDEREKDFKVSGLLLPSIIRVTRLAVVSEEMLIGNIGEISLERSSKIKNNSKIVL